MSRVLIAFACGLLFGSGLIIAQMTNPAKIIGFLDITGQWDPSLALVMAGATIVFGIAYRLASRRKAPLLDTRFVLPEKTGIDKSLVGGSFIFGLGWGLAGFCPGPAIVSSGFGDARVWAFVASMLSAMALTHWLRRRLTGD
ncbi:MAG: YeeE/YedE family protein [Burkholderiales bacterium]